MTNKHDAALTLHKVRALVGLCCALMPGLLAAQTNLPEPVERFSTEQMAQILETVDSRGLADTASVSPDGGRLASDAQDKTVRLWDPTPASR